MSERETRGYRAKDHDHQRHTVNFLPPELITKPPEKELTGEGPTEGNAVDGGGNVGRESPRHLGAWNVVVNAAEELCNERDAKEIVSVGEESHSGDYNRREMVPLGLGYIKCIQHL